MFNFLEFFLIFFSVFHFPLFGPSDPLFRQKSTKLDEENLNYTVINVPVVKFKSCAEQENSKACHQPVTYSEESSSRRVTGSKGGCRADTTAWGASPTVAKPPSTIEPPRYVSHFKLCENKK